MQRHSLLIVLAIATAFAAASVIAAWWVWSESPVDFRPRLLSILVGNSLLMAVVFVVSVLALFDLMRRTRRRDQEQARTAQLAELGLLAGGLSHELRNSLNAIGTHLALLNKQLDGTDNHKAMQRIHMIQRELDDLEKLVSEFLIFARPSLDRLEEVDLSQLVDEVLQFLALDMAQAGIDVVVDVPPDLPKLFVDTAKLKHVLLNLIVNARQAMENGGTLAIRARHYRGWIILEISDTGCGIPPEHHDKIFQTFYSTKSEGTGLGLAIVKRTVEDFGGTVSFTSKVGEGTTFQLRLPSAHRYRMRLRRRGAS
ncbi:MAG: hypothetical protein KatS3mg105_3980 [Gemmatales bacterium]|nr:MAG: hypothetical protein KatS3mg105_3980 [Gemmatales bacterium]